MFKHRNPAELLINQSLKGRKNSMCDIVDGVEYKKGQAQKGKYDLTLIFHTDGIEIVESSKSHCYPLMFMIAEIPIEHRSSYTLFNGVWYDKSKPNMNKFLKPFCKKLKKFRDKGISWTDPKTKAKNTSKISVEIVVADAPVRAELQNTLAHNGTYSCNTCEIETTSIVLGKTKDDRVKKESLLENKI